MRGFFPVRIKLYRGGFLLNQTGPFDLCLLLYVIFLPKRLSLNIRSFLFCKWRLYYYFISSLRREPQFTAVLPHATRLNYEHWNMELSSKYILVNMNTSSRVNFDGSKVFLRKDISSARYLVHRSDVPYIPSALFAGFSWLLNLGQSHGVFQCRIPVRKNQLVSKLLPWLNNLNKFQVLYQSCSSMPRGWFSYSVVFSYIVLVHSCNWPIDSGLPPSCPGLYDLRIASCILIIWKPYRSIIILLANYWTRRWW